MLIRRALGRCGYQVDVAATLGEARGMDPGGYDAVLVDANLGPERGIDLVNALRSEDPGAASRCLVMTGGPADTLPDDVAYLAKPFQMEELIGAVRALHEVAAAPAAGWPAVAAPEPGAPPGPSAPPGGDQPPAGQPPVWQLLRLTRRLRARERHELVDFLHDGPIQELTAATLELQMMSRSTPSAPRLDMLLNQLTAAAGSLRWLVTGPWPFLEPETRLADVLPQRTSWLLAAPLTVDCDEQTAGRGTVAPVIADVVELMLLAMVTASPPAKAHVVVRAQEHGIRIELTLTPATGDGQAIGDPAEAEAALAELASALGASAHTTFREQDWGAHLVLRMKPD